MRRLDGAALVVVVFAFVSRPCGAQRTLSVEKEAALGAQLAADVRRQTQPVANQAVQDYAQRVCDRLSAHIASPWPWHVEVVIGLSSGQTKEARWFPGGLIFLPVELFLKARNEGELAGMLAHAMAHVASHDLTKATVQQYGTIPLVFLDWQNSLAIPRAFVAKQKELESEADIAGIQLMRKAGYKPEDLSQADQDFAAIQNEVRLALPSKPIRQKPSLFGSTSAK